MTENDKEENDELNDNARIALLNNYYQEVTSHSVNILATIVATFVLIQIYFEINAELLPFYFKFSLLFVIGALIGMTIYLIGRTLYWSILTTTILTARHDYDRKKAVEEEQTRLSYLQNRAVDKGVYGTRWWKGVFLFFAFRWKKRRGFFVLLFTYPIGTGLVFAFFFLGCACATWISGILAIVVAIAIFFVSSNKKETEQNES